MEAEKHFLGYPIIVTISAVAVATSYYLFSVAQKPKISTGNKKLREFLSSKVAIVNETYYPHYFIWEGRLQSILGLSLRISDPYRLPYTREIFNLKDGGVVGVDFLFPENFNEKSMIVYILPGLTSHSQTSYVKTIVLSIVSAGGLAVVHNHRGLGGVPVTTPRLYSATNFDDSREVTSYLNEKYPLQRKIILGTSMGAMIVSNYLSSCPEEAKKSYVAGLAISSTWDTSKGIESLEKAFVNRYIINSAITKNLQKVAARHKETIEATGLVDYNKVLSCTNLRDFDAFFTVPIFGYGSVDEYYRNISVLDKKISNFSIPMFALNAEDDPMSPGDALPFSQAEKPGSNFVLITTSRGGHLGYLEGMLPVRKTSHFMERFVSQFVKAIHEDNATFP